MKNKKTINQWVMRGIIFLAVIALGFLGFSVYKEFLKKKQVDEDIRILKEQAEKIKQENMTLEERIAYLSSQDYQKVQARDKLDLQGPGENVVVITQESSSLNQSEKKSETINNDAENHPTDNTSNFLKWWNYFLGNK